jgi:hypothetical protein
VIAFLCFCDRHTACHLLVPLHTLHTLHTLSHAHPLITRETGLRSRLRLPSSLQLNLSLAPKHTTQPCRNASKTTAAPHYHQTAAREHVNTLPEKHHVKCEKRLSACPSVQKQTHCLRAAALPRPPNSLSSLCLRTNTTHRKAPLLPSYRPQDALL